MLHRFLGSLLLTGSLLLAASPLCLGQEATIPNVESWYFSGLSDVEGRYYYFVRQVRNKPGELVLDLYGRDLKLLSSTTVNLGYYTTLRTTGLAGDDPLFFFQSGDKAQVLRFNAQGQKINEVGFGAENVFGSQSFIRPASAGDVYVAYPVQTSKKGFMVIRYAPDFKVKWQKEFSPEKGRYQLKYFEATDANVYALADYSKEGWRVVALDGATGAERGQHPLPADNAEINPQITTLDEAGSLLLAGTYREKASNGSDGFFTMKLNPTGQVATAGRTPYGPDIDKLLHSRSTLADLVTNERPRLKIHRLLPRPDGTWTLLGETYREAGSTGANPGQAVPFSRAVYDFVVAQINAKGQIETVRRIPKPFRLYQQANGLGSFHGPEAFENRSSFAYRFLDAPTGTAAEPAIVFLNWYHNQYYVNHVRFTDARDNLFGRAYLDLAVVPGADRGERTQQVFEYNPPTGKNAWELAYTDVLPHSPGKYLFYHYNKDTQVLEMKVLPVPAHHPITQ